MSRPARSWSRGLDHSAPNGMWDSRLRLSRRATCWEADSRGRLSHMLQTAALLACLLLIAAVQSGQADEPQPATLQLNDGGYIKGRLLPSSGEAIHWQGEAFTEAFTFPTNTVRTLHWLPPESRPKPEGDFLVELSGGDLLFGDLITLDEETLTLKTARFGRLDLKRADVQRLRRWQGGADLLYNGPGPLSDWSVSPKDTWEGRTGAFSTKEPDASLVGDVSLPDQALVELEISWKARPNFFLALGVNPAEEVKRLESLQVQGIAKPKPGAQPIEVAVIPRSALAFEVWGDDLVALLESDQSADLAKIGQVDDGPGRLQLRIYLNQKQGRALIDSASGQRLADFVAAPEPGHEAQPGIILTNFEGDVQLDRLTVTRWNGAILPDGAADQPRLIREDGTVELGTVHKLDAEAGELTFKNDSNEFRVPLESVAEITLSPQLESLERSVRIVYQDGSRLSGDLKSVGEDSLKMTVPGVEGEGAISPTLKNLRSLAFLHDGQDRGTPTEDGPIGRLELEGTKLQGHLEPGQEQPKPSALAWKPLASKTASPLRHDVSGRIVYREPPPPKPQGAAPRATPPPNPAPVPVVRLLQGLFLPREPSQVDPANPRHPMLYLVSGDQIPSEIDRIDEQGVWFTSPLSENKFVPHEKVKAIVLNTAKPTVKLGKARRERLLTLPRIQKGNPPTHLLRSAQGDYLRGRLVGMGPKTIRVEVRLEEKDLPRGLVSQVIWLHPEELANAEAIRAPKPAGEAIRVQALLDDGVRLSFAAERFDDGTLFGRSEVLGPCQVSLDKLDQLLIGEVIDQEASQLAFGRWKLTQAPEPQISEIGGGSGMESALVGKPAPNFKLDRLDGQPFQLAEHRGKVIVLDFWATWCGPCIQSMPQVERVAREFEEQGVELFAVNLQESAEQIKPMLERYQLSPTVLLDRDGAVAQRYEATAIPQTVLIDPGGQIVRLWVGASSHLEEQLREAIRGLLDPPS